MAAPSTLALLLDALLPAETPGDGGPAYPSASAVGVDREVAERIGRLPAGERAELARLFRVVDSRFANLLLSGRPIRFRGLTPSGREEYLRRWSVSGGAIKRRGFQAIKRLGAGVYYARPTADGRHPLWPRIHYAPPPLPDPPPDPFADLPAVRPPDEREITADVCVIGSGAGGAVIAARLAAVGYRTIILEAGPWVPRQAYPRQEGAALDQLFLGGATVTNSDHSIAILAGSTVGGGTAINWMTCLPPRAEARREWAGSGGMAGVDGPEFDRCYARAVDRLHVSTAESDVNPSNETLRRGCRALGYREGTDWAIIPRNAVGCRSRCGFCTFGCPYGARQSALTTYLADALHHGARLCPSTRAVSIEVEGGHVRGVLARVEGAEGARDLHVRCATVVVAAGALQTPALLLRSGVRFEGVGRGLRLDPTVAIAAEFPQPIRTWDGPHQTIRVYRFQSTDAGAHGPWIEVAPTHPGLAAVALPWDGAATFRRRMERLERVATPIALVRDSGEGRVRSDPDGRPIIDYVLTPPDRANLVRGMREAARIMVAAGATRLTSLHTPAIEAGDGTRPVAPAELDRWLAETEARGIRENALALFSAHPMGSARAGPDPRTSTARPTGEVHGVEGLWIGDGSLLPSAPGVNPMMSILALAERTADQLIGRLGGRPSSESR